MVLWFKIEIDDITESAISECFQGLQDEWSALDARFLHGIDPYDSKALSLAEKEAQNFFNNVLLADNEIDDQSQEEVTV